MCERERGVSYKVLSNGTCCLVVKLLSAKSYLPSKLQLVDEQSNHII